MAPGSRFRPPPQLRFLPGTREEAETAPQCEGALEQRGGTTSAQPWAGTESPSLVNSLPTAFPQVTDLKGLPTRDSRSWMGIAVFLGLVGSLAYSPLLRYENITFRPISVDVRKCAELFTLSTGLSLKIVPASSVGSSSP